MGDATNQVCLIVARCIFEEETVDVSCRFHISVGISKYAYADSIFLKISSLTA